MSRPSPTLGIRRPAVLAVAVAAALVGVPALPAHAATFTVSGIAGLESTVSSAAAGDVIRLGAAIDGSTSTITVPVDLDLDLNGNDLDLERLILAEGVTLRVLDPIGGALLHVATSTAGLAAIRTTGATFDVASGFVLAEGGSGAADIGGDQGIEGDYVDGTLQVRFETSGRGGDGGTLRLSSDESAVRADRIGGGDGADASGQPVAGAFLPGSGGAGGDAGRVELAGGILITTQVTGGDGGTADAETPLAEFAAGGAGGDGPTIEISAGTLLAVASEPLQVGGGDGGDGGGAAPEELFSGQVVMSFLQHGGDAGSLTMTGGVFGETASSAATSTFRGGSASVLAEPSGDYSTVGSGGEGPVLDLSGGARVVLDEIRGGRGADANPTLDSFDPVPGGHGGSGGTIAASGAAALHVGSLAGGDGGEPAEGSSPFAGAARAGDGGASPSLSLKDAATAATGGPQPGVAGGATGSNGGLGALAIQDDAEWSVLSSFSIPSGVTVTGAGLIDGTGATSTPTISNAGAIHPRIDDALDGGSLSVTGNAFPVAFVAPGGTAVPPLERVYATSFLAGARTLASATHPSFALGSWNTLADGTGTEVTTSTTLSGPLTAYAVWEGRLLSLSSTSPTAGSTVTGSVSDGGITDVTADYSFSSTDPAATVSGGEIVFRTAGAHTVTATPDVGEPLTAAVVVAPAATSALALELTPSTGPLEAGVDTVTVNASGLDAFGNATGDLDPAEWTLSTDDPLATVAGTTVTPRTAGTLELTGAVTSQPSATGRASIEVVASNIAAIVLTASATTVPVGGSLSFTASGVDAYGNPTGDLSGLATLTSDVPTDVVSGMTVTFPTASPHRITATYLDLDATVTIEVEPAAAADDGSNGSGDLAATGSTLGMLPAAALLVVLGLLTSLVLRRRLARD